MGKGNFRPPPTESTPLNRSPTKFSQVITSETHTVVPNLVHIRSPGLLGEWVEYNQNFIYLFMPLLETHLQIRPGDRFSCMIAQTTRIRVRMCFLGFVDMAPHLWGQILPKNRHFGAWIGIFKPNSRNQKTCILLKLWHRSQSNFPPNTLRGWPKHAYNKSKMADSRHIGKIENSLYLIISATVWPIATKFGIMTQFNSLERSDS